MGTFSCIFLLISTYLPHISTYFHVYFYLFLHIYCYFLHAEHYIYYYLPRVLPASARSPQKCVVLLQIATKVCCFTTDCHKSVLFYYRLPQKCGILLQFDTKVCYFTDTSKVRCFIKSTSN